MSVELASTEEMIGEFQRRFIDTLIIYTMPEKQGTDTIPRVHYSGGGIAAMGLIALAKRMILDEMTGLAEYALPDDDE